MRLCQHTSLRAFQNQLRRCTCAQVLETPIQEAHTARDSRSRIDAGCSQRQFSPLRRTIEGTC